MKKYLMAAAVSGVLAVTASSAAAVPVFIDFGLGATGAIGESVTYNLGGVVLTVSAANGGIDRSLTRQSSGFGLRSDPQVETSDGFDALDATVESMDFNFSAPVKISSIQFGGFGPNDPSGNPDEYDLFIGAPGPGNLISVLQNSGSNANFDPKLETDFVRLRAESGDFRVRSISFETAAVPLPAGLPLLAGALGLLALARRRKA